MNAVIKWREHNLAGMKCGVLLMPLIILLGPVGIAAHAEELKPETVAAFDHYIAATEARMDSDMRLNQFLVVDRLPDSKRQEV